MKKNTNNFYESIDLSKLQMDFVRKINEEVSEKPLEVKIINPIFKDNIFF